jgi:hypothetical protein
MAAELDKYRIPGTCEAFYIPDFLTEDEESYLIRKVRSKYVLSAPLHLH